jgi:hypothetical protein
MECGEGGKGKRMIESQHVIIHNICEGREYVLKSVEKWRMGGKG